LESAQTNRNDRFGLSRQGLQDIALDSSQNVGPHNIVELREFILVKPLAEPLGQFTRIRKVLAIQEVEQVEHFQKIAKRNDV